MADLPVVRNRRDAEAHDSDKPALVEVPGNLVKAVVWMVETVEKPGNEEVTKVLKTLLRRRENRT
jgi:hypothetical protein